MLKGIFPDNLKIARVTPPFKTGLHLKQENKLSYLTIDLYQFYPVFQKVWKE